MSQVRAGKNVIRRIVNRYEKNCSCELCGFPEEHEQLENGRICQI